jgi:hypothetical protein
MVNNKMSASHDADELDHVDLSDKTWVAALLKESRRTLPEFGRQLQERAAVPTFAWYRSVTGSGWSGRLNGLQICTLSHVGSRLTFNVGKAGAQGRNSDARHAFLRIVRDNESLCGQLNTQGELEVSSADELRCVALLQLPFSFQRSGRAARAPGTWT